MRVQARARTPSHITHPHIQMHPCKSAAARGARGACTHTMRVGYSLPANAPAASRAAAAAASGIDWDPSAAAAAPGGGPLPGRRRSPRRRGPAGGGKRRRGLRLGCVTMTRSDDSDEAYFQCLVDYSSSSTARARRHKTFGAHHRPCYCKRLCQTCRGRLAYVVATSPLY